MNRSPLDRGKNHVLLSPTLVAGAPVAQLDRASASGAEGHRFKSCQAHQHKEDSKTDNLSTIPGGPLAQLVEQLTLNQRAVGSTPTRPTTFHILETTQQF